jgi:hypothetical protein
MYVDMEDVKIGIRAWYEAVNRMLLPQTRSK